MKPISLKISAFGPYKDEIFLDFTELNKAKLFLITGNTGSGKTTLFDAIVYALYGVASGDVRETNSFRCKYSDNSIKTYVEFIFEINGVEYLVNRVPEYQRTHLKNEDKIVTNKATAYLQTPSKTIDGQKNVTEEITNLLGIDKNQFSQIAMIAQGEFLKLLLADTSERMKIFRNIFKTSNYSRFQDAIKNKELSLKKQNDQMVLSVLQYLENLEINNEDILNLINNLNKTKQLTNIDVIIDAIEKEIKFSNDKIELLEKDNTKLIENINLIQSEIGKMQVLIDNTSKIEKASKYITENYDELQKLKMNIKTLENEKEKIELDKIKLDNLIKLEQSQNNIQDEINKIKIDIKNNESIKAKLEDNLENNKTEIATLNKKILSVKSKEEIELLKANLTNSQIKVQQLKNVLEVASECSIEITKLIEYEEKFHKLIEIFNHENTEFIEQEKLFFNSQISYIASKLETSKPCPVCGSTTHPQIAPIAPTQVTKEQIDILKNKVESKRALINKKQILIESTNALIEEKRKTINISSDEDLSEIITLKKSTLKELNLKISDTSKTISTYEKELEEQIKLVEKMDILSNENQNIIDKMQVCKETLIMLTTQKTEKLTIFNKEKLVDKVEIKNLKNKIDSYYVEYTTKENELVKKNNKFIEAKLLKETLEKQIKGFQILDINILKTNLNLNKEQQLLNNNTIKSLDYQIKINQSTLDSIEKVLEEIKKVNSKYSYIKSLSDTANGTIPQKEKIMFEAYVQMSYFDKVIQHANTRFMIMSSGQFELKRKSGGINYRSQSGLELDVIDHYNGSIRSVKSLSGGESFMASLALALGLSDEIQQSSGGINIESMFVDEGFGTLSEEALESSIKILSQLANGSKLVGIISHVQELKQRIDTQVYIEKQKENGSKIKIIV